MSQPTLDADVQWNANIAGLGLRQQGNEFFEALLTKMSGASAPNPTYQFMNWIDISVSPAVWRIRSADNLSWNDFAQIDSSEDAPNQIILLNAGEGIPSLGIAQTFTQKQTIKEDGSVGELAVGSTLQSGIVARMPLFGHNSNNAETVGANLVLRLNTNTAGSESFTLEIETRRAGVITNIVSIGSVNIFDDGSGNKICDFDTVRQDGEDLDDIIAEANGKIRNDGSFSNSITLNQTNAGGYIRYNGSGAAVITVPKLEDGTWVMVMNDSSDSSSLTFESAANPDDVEFSTNRLTLRAGSGTERPKCMVFSYLSNGQLVDILGQNTTT